MHRRAMASACVGHRERSLRPGDCDFLRPVVVTDLATSFSTELIGKYPFFFWRGAGVACSLNTPYYPHNLDLNFMAHPPSLNYLY